MIADRIKSLFSQVKRHEQYQDVFVTTQGQAVLDHICQQGYVFKTTAHSDPHEMAIREGHRMLALAILKHVYKDHGKIQQRVNQQLERIMSNESTT